jgi:hypothetical protein
MTKPIRSIGKGKLYTKGDIAAAIRDFKITPMIQFPGASGVTGTARQTKDETLFFIANTTPLSNSFTASFRINGLRPELWDAETGSIRFAPVWRKRRPHRGRSHARRLPLDLRGLPRFEATRRPRRGNSRALFGNPRQ